MPDGRNSRLKMLDINTLLLGKRLKRGDNNDPRSLRKKHFVPAENAYIQYLSIVRGVSQALWGDEKHIHEVEMLLFALADGDIYEQVFDRLAES
jgi:hypothetical protein